MTTTGPLTRARDVTVCTALAIALAVAAGGCGTTTRPGPVSRSRPVPATLTAQQTQTLRAYGQSDTAFGLSVLSALCRADPAANQVMSPASLAASLGLAELGARGATQAAIAKVLHLPAAGNALVSGLAARASLLATLNRPGVSFAASNRVWADPGLSTSRTYLARVRAAYQAGLTHVPLLTQPEAARHTINAAISADTHGHIPDLLPPGSLNEAGWVLTDALYLDAAWAHPFDPSQTTGNRFTTTVGQVTAHYLSGGEFRMARAQGWTAMSLPYRGGRLTMVAVLPPAGAGCPAIEPATLTSLAGQAARTSRSGTRPQAGAAFAGWADIALPKVNLNMSTPLNGVLTRLGMGVAFSGQADFTGLSPAAGQLGLVQHAATLQVGEKGTVASAATATTVLPAAAAVPRVPVVTFNRPYLLMIEDTVTGEPLMLARVANPAAH